MKLFYAAGSPYARIVRIALLETWVDHRVEKQEVTLRDPNSALLPINPGGKVPTLQLDDGTILTESLLILAFIDTQHPGRKLLPMDGSDGWRTLAGVARAIGFLDGISVWNREIRRPENERSPSVIALETARAERVAEALEQAVGAGGYSGDDIDAAQIVLGVALENCSRRHKVWPWRTGRPRLAAWLDEVATRPSFTSTLQPELNL